MTVWMPNITLIYIYIYIYSQTKVIKTLVLWFNALLECSSVCTNDPFVFYDDYFGSEQFGIHSHQIIHRQSARTPHGGIQVNRNCCYVHGRNQSLFAFKAALIHWDVIGMDSGCKKYPIAFWWQFHVSDYYYFFSWCYRSLTYLIKLIAWWSNRLISALGYFTI